jgi:hypothetical protein
MVVASVVRCGSADGDIEGMEEVSRCFGSVEGMKLFYVLVTIVFWLVNFINIVHYVSCVV